MSFKICVCVCRAVSIIRFTHMATPSMAVATDVTLVCKKLDAWKARILFEFDRMPLNTIIRIPFEAKSTDPLWIYWVLFPAIKLMNLDAELHYLDVDPPCQCVKMDGPCSHWTKAELKVSLKYTLKC